MLLFNAKMRSFDGLFGSFFKNSQNDSKIKSCRTFFKDLKNLSKFKSLSPVLSCCRGYCSAHPPSLPERAGESACLERILSNVKMLKKLVILKKTQFRYLLTYHSSQYCNYPISNSIQKTRKILFYNNHHFSLRTSSFHY